MDSIRNFLLDNIKEKHLVNYILNMKQELEDSQEINDLLLSNYDIDDKDTLKRKDRNDIFYTCFLEIMNDYNNKIHFKKFKDIIFEYCYEYIDYPHPFLGNLNNNDFKRIIELSGYQFKYINRKKYIVKKNNN